MREYIVTEHPDFPYEDPKPQELIRCRDCKFYMNMRCYRHHALDDLRWESDFCSYASRKDEVEQDEAD